MLLGATYKMDPNDSYTPAEYRSTEELDSLLHQGMDNLEFKYGTACINFCFKYIGLQECTEVLGGQIGLQDYSGGKSPERNTIAINQQV